MAKLKKKIAVIGGSGYLASLIKNQNKSLINQYIFFSRKKNIDYSSLNKLKVLMGFDYLIYLSGPNQSNFKKKKTLIYSKNKVVERICDVCLSYNIKLIYISSLQIYKNYGKQNIKINSPINLKNLYSKSHYNSENIIFDKLSNYKRKFIIIRMGNVFGFQKYNNLKQIKTNLIHDMCISAIKEKKICVNKGSLYRTFIPSKIFVRLINKIISKNYFNNSIEDFFYSYFSLRDIGLIIKKRFKIIFNSNIELIVKKFKKNINLKNSFNRKFKFKIDKKKVYSEIDHILKYLKKNL